MADPHGFLTTRTRELPARRPVPIRLMDYREIAEAHDPAQLHRQAGRCMDCAVPFCHHGCPLGNLIPEWNDATWRDEPARALELLHATNNFPEFTGRACPAPCEDSCVLAISQPAVTIKQIEVSTIDRGFEMGLVTPHIPDRMTGKTVGIVGSGPAGLAAAQQLTRAGHTVVVYEREDRIGGLLRYGIPDFKLEKHTIDRRLAQLRAEGTRFRTGIEIGVDISYEQLRERFDAVIIATGAPVPRDLPIPGRELAGIHHAMDYLVPVNRQQAGDDAEIIDAAGRHVVIIGGGDTGSDCIGTALRQQAASVTTLAIGAEPPAERPADQPWPMTPRTLEISTSHEEGGTRRFLASTISFLDRGDGHIGAVRLARTRIQADGSRVPEPGTEETLDADLVLLALGFSGPEQPFPRGEDYASTDTAGVFICGDAGRGQSLIVWAIAEGRACAAAVDRHLLGSTDLPAPVRPADRGFHVKP